MVMVAVVVVVVVKNTEYLNLKYFLFLQVINNLYQ